MRTLASPNGRRSTPSTTSTACTRASGRLAVRRWSSPRLILSRCSSCVTVNPANATTPPTTDSSSAAHASAAASSASPTASSGSWPSRRSPSSGESRSWAAAAAAPTIGRIDAELRRRQRRDQERTAAQPPCGSGVRARIGQPDDRPEPARLAGGDRPQDDLPFAAAARGLDVQRLHPEQPLDRPLHAVDRLDAPERDRGVVRREDAPSEMQRAPGDPIGGVTPAQVADRHGDRHPGQPEHQAEQRRAPAPGEQAEHQAHEDLAQVVQRRQHDLRDVEVARRQLGLRSCGASAQTTSGSRASSPIRSRSSPASVSVRAGMVCLPAAV